MFISVIYINLTSIPKFRYNMNNIKMSEILEKKRKREPNITLGEKHLLLDLIEEHFSIIESKKTNAVTVRTKLKEWEKIGDEFNCQNTQNTRREWQTLKLAWENLKKLCRKQLSSERQNRIVTGGGPSTVVLQDPILERVHALLNETCEGLVNPFDSDSGVQFNTEPDEEPLQDETIVLEVIEDFDNSRPEEPLNGDWSCYTPETLSSRPCNILKAGPSKLTSSSCSRTPTSNRRRPVLSQKEAEQLAEVRKSAVEVAKMQATEEHNVKMEILNIQKSRELTLLEQEKIKLELLKMELEKKRKNG